MKEKIKRIIKKYFIIDKCYREYYRRFNEYSYLPGKCSYYRQYEAAITRMYHIIEKGLSYCDCDYRAGFGEEAVKELISLLKQYSEKYDIDEFFYQTALSCLNEYINKNAKFGYVNVELEKEIRALCGEGNDCGGSITFTPIKKEEEVSFERLLCERHSIRHFSPVPVDMGIIMQAIILAQHTPSACNRQGWRSIVIEDSDVKKIILDNQNGNRGFGEEIDKIILVVSELKAFSRDWERFQSFIDGGMYAQNLINALTYYGIANVPLSASLSYEQDCNVRKIARIDDSEVLIMIIGVGNYPDVCISTKSYRKQAKCEII